AAHSSVVSYPTRRSSDLLAYVVAAGQWGEHAGGRKTYGHSMVIGPWGDVLAERPEGPGIVTAELDMIGLERLRQQFPVLAHRRRSEEHTSELQSRADLVC